MREVSIHISTLDSAHTTTTLSKGCAGVPMEQWPSSTAEPLTMGIAILPLLFTIKTEPPRIWFSFLVFLTEMDPDYKKESNDTGTNVKTNDREERVLPDSWSPLVGNYRESVEKVLLRSSSGGIYQYIQTECL